MILILILILLAITTFGQDVTIVQHSSFCEANAGLGGPGSYRERIKNIERTDKGNYSITTVLVRDCKLPIFPVKALNRADTLFITTSQVEMATYQLTNGLKVSRLYSEEECKCAFELRMEVVTDSISNVSVDNKVLERTEEKLITYPIRYFLFKGDTTGHEDKYGRRQGYIITARKNDLLKSIYKDGVQVGCELLSLDGRLIRAEKDCNSFVDSKTK